MAIDRATILLEGHTVDVEIGIHDFERGVRQRVTINVEMDVEIDPDPESVRLADDIASVLDYDFLRTGIAELVSTRRFNLQETLCLEILSLIRGRLEVRRAVVTTRKPDVCPDADAVGFRLSWSRDD